MVNFDAASGRLKLSGESNMSDSSEFYRPLLYWIEEYRYDGPGPVEMTFSFSYLNDGSQRQIHEILNELTLVQDSGKGVQVYWYYHEDDTDMEELGHNFANEYELPFSIWAH